MRTYAKLTALFVVWLTIFAAGCTKGSGYYHGKLAASSSKNLNTKKERL